MMSLVWFELKKRLIIIALAIAFFLVTTWYFAVNVTAENMAAASNILTTPFMIYLAAGITLIILCFWDTLRLYGSDLYRTHGVTTKMLPISPEKKILSRFLVNYIEWVLLLAALIPFAITFLRKGITDEGWIELSLLIRANIPLILLTIVTVLANIAAYILVAYTVFTVPKVVFAGKSGHMGYTIIMLITFTLGITEIKVLLNYVVTLLGGRALDLANIASSAPSEYFDPRLSLMIGVDFLLTLLIIWGLFKFVVYLYKRIPVLVLSNKKKD